MMAIIVRWASFYQDHAAIERIATLYGQRAPAIGSRFADFSRPLGSQDRCSTRLSIRSVCFWIDDQFHAPIAGLAGRARVGDDRMIGTVTNHEQLPR